MKILFKHTPAFLFVLTILFSSCAEELIGSKNVNDPVANFDYFWRTFDAKYGLFEVKKIDWQKVYETYRPLVSSKTTDEELYLVLKQMINTLNDNHVNLYPTNGELPAYPGGLLRVVDGVVMIKKAQDDYDPNVVKTYLQDFRQHTGNLSSGVLNNEIGYLNIKGTESLKDARKAMDDIMDRLGSKKAVIVDVRGFYGGSDAVAQLLAGYFAAEKKVYMTTRKRNGPRHTDFTDPVSWYVDPSDKRSFTKPVILLTSRFTQSAGETLTLAFKESAHVTLMGDTTAGSLSDNPTTEMYNGWMFSLSVGDFRDAGGTSYEGIGIAPHIAIVNQPADLLQGKDRVLEQALLKLQ